MDLLLTHAYMLAEDDAEQRIMRPYAPMGLLSIAAYLELNGYDTRLFDATFQDLTTFADLLQRERPPVVGIYLTLMTKPTGLNMIRIAKEHGALVVLGGPEPPFYADEYLARGADIVVVGEGERTMEEILRAAASGTPDFSRIDGIVLRREDGSILRTAARRHFPDLDLLPMPARHKIRLEDYLNAWRQAHGYTSLSIVSMRGCPFTCRWCSHAVYGESYRRRSPDLVVEEIASVVDDYHPDRLWFADDVFTINHRWFFDLAEALRRRRLSIRYECITRADRLNEAVIHTMAETGCEQLWIGGESGSQRILDDMSRGVTPEEVRAMTHLAQQNGIRVGTFVMFGYTGETKADIEETIRHVRAMRPDQVLTTTAYPIRGTAFYSEIEERLVHPSLPFEEWNDRLLDFTGRYSKRFYRFAGARAVHETELSGLMQAHDRTWLRIASSFLRAKAAQLGMAVSR